MVDLLASCFCGWLFTQLFWTPKPTQEYKDKCKKLYPDGGNPMNPPGFTCGRCCFAPCAVAMNDGFNPFTSPSCFAGLAGGCLYANFFWTPAVK